MFEHSTKEGSNMTSTIKRLYSLFALTLLVSSIFAGSPDLLARNAQWSYQDDGKDLGTAWIQPDFADKNWKKGPAPLGFGDDYSETDPKLALATPVSFGPAADAKIMTTYFRTTVDLTAEQLKAPELSVYIHVDDGAVVYFNGKEAFRRGIKDGEPVVFSTPGKFKPKEETFAIPSSLLKVGPNTIAVEVHQDGPDSSDLWFEMGISSASSPATVTKTAVKLPDPSAPLGTITKVVATFSTDSTSTQAFTWYSTKASIASNVQAVEIKQGQKADFTKATLVNGRFGLSTNSPEEVWHKAELTGLKASTLYAYRVGDASLNLWSNQGQFRTAAKQGAFTFINLADTQAKSEDEALLSAETLAKSLATVKDARFISINGDIVDTGMNEQQWGWMLNHSAPTLQKTTFLPAAGNHDEDPESFIEHFNLPVPAGAATKSGAYYSVDYQSAHLIVLNNNEDSPEWADFTPAQIEWLKADVAAARKKGSSWIIAIMHKGPYTSSNHASDMDMTDPTNGVRTKFAPLASELGIDLVLQGHDHIYARTKPLMNNKPATKGTVFIIPGTAGPKTYYRNKKMDAGYWELFAMADENHAAAYGPDPKDASRPVRGQVQHFLAITVDAKKVTVNAYEIDQAKNKAQPFVMDTFTLTK